MTRVDWAELGLRVLVEEGPAGLTVERLCARAGRTRGSLYHHFREHDELLHAVVERWVQMNTDRVVAEAGDDDMALNRLALALDFEVEQGIRTLVARHGQLRPRVAAVDRQRVDALAKLHGVRGVVRPREVAEIEYAAFLGFQQLSPSKRRLHTLYRRFRQMCAADVDGAERAAAG